jgi:hypothetical protein
MTVEKTHAKNEAPVQQQELWEGWFEVISATILGLAMLASAWSAYQSGLWGGIQDFRIAEAHISGRQAAEKAVFANQLRGIDVILFERYVTALSENNQQRAQFLVQRFRPEFKVAAEAWLTTQPLKNPSAPRSPFVMKEYSLAVENEMRQLRQEEEKQFTEARKANGISDTYLLLTVLFSVVLFLGGITAAFERRPVRFSLIALSAIMLMGAATAMAFLPLANE